MSESNSVINALLRLQRAGAEDSKATAKLVEAARVASDAICQHIGLAGCQMLAKYSIAGLGTYVLPNAEGQAYRLELRHQRPYPPVHADRQAALDFAWHLAHGCLDELAHWLEERAVEATQAATVLAEKAAKGEVQA